jgi:hypothetical protein
MQILSKLDLKTLNCVLFLKYVRIVYTNPFVSSILTNLAHSFIIGAITTIIYVWNSKHTLKQIISIFGWQSFMTFFLSYSYPGKAIDFYWKLAICGGIIVKNIK